MPFSAAREPDGPARPLILLAVTDARALDLLDGMLRERGFEVRQAGDGAAVRRALREHPPQGVVLSLLLPGCDPWRLLGELRAQARDLPVVVTSPVYVEDDAIRAYRLGADDYITYVLSTAQSLPRVAARFRRLLPRREDAPAGRADGRPGLRITVDRPSRIARADGTPLDLTPLEFDLLAVLTAHPERVLSHGQLLRQVWGEEEHADPGRVKYAVLRLRRKIAEATGGRTGIATVRGIGYRYRPGD